MLRRCRERKRLRSDPGQINLEVGGSWWVPHEAPQIEAWRESRTMILPRLEQDLR